MTGKAPGFAMPPMSVSHEGSELLLLWVWRASLILAVVAVYIALVLACKRWLEERARGRKAVRRQRVSRLVQALLASPLELTPRSVPPLDPRDAPALFSVALGILRVTRGRDADRMLALLEVWNLRPYLAGLVVRGRRSRQIRALTLLARFRDEESLALLLKFVSHPGIYVQLAALRGVADRGDALHLPEVVDALSRSRETNVPMLADILRRFGEPAVPELAELAASPVAALGVRVAAVMALGSIGSLTALDPLLEMSRDPNPVLRACTLESLAKLGDPRSAPAVLRGLAETEARVRAAAAKTAGLLGLREVLPVLADVLYDEVWEVRYRAAEALYLMGAPGIAVLRAAAAGGGGGPETVEAHAAEMAGELLAEKEGIPA
jgi:HEAT repeat protein